MANESQGKGTVLVTGGAGFIGSALVWGLNERGTEDVIVCDRLGTDEKWRNLVPLGYRDYVDADDLLKSLDQTVNPMLKGVKTILHMGACSSTTERDAGFLMKNNFEYTRALAEWATRNRVRFVYASSAATYGDGAQGMSDRDPDFEKLRPLNMYGYSKHLFDCWAAKRGILRTLVGVKYFNVFGPNEDHKDDMRSMVNKAYAEIAQTGKVRLFKSYRHDFADGEQKRDFLYVKDAVNMTLHLAGQPLGGGLFNLGSGQASTWVQLAEAIFAALGIPPQIEFIEMPDALKGQYQYYTCAEIEKLKNTGYSDGLTGLREAVYDYVVNYLVAGKRLGD